MGLEVLGVFVAGVVLGIVGYRWMAKNNPDTVVKWAADLKKAGKDIRARLDGL